MSFFRMMAIGGVYLLACGGWGILGTTTLVRSSHFSEVLGEDVKGLFGGPIEQEAPELSVKVPGAEERRRLMPSSNAIRVRLGMDYRRKGLVWYSTFVSDFAGTYEVTNKEKVAQKVRLHFKFPAAQATYDNFSFRVDGEKRDVPVDTAGGLRDIIEVGPEKTRKFTITYRTRGLDEWRYRPAAGTGRVQKLELDMTTDFHEIDYPEGSLSPTSPAEPGEEGMHVAWKASDLITSQDIGMIMPERINPGPLSARITFFAPVCLIFFFVLIAAINIVCRVNIHPMHYLFVAAGFVAFHLLFAYLVDHVNVHVSFLVAAVTTVLLVTGYLRAALGGAFPWKISAAGQIFYLVLFSYSFFLRGVTGLTVTVGSVLTLGVLMRVTAKIDWFEFFSLRKRAKEAAARLIGSA